jgi:hypothetical protein
MVKVDTTMEYALIANPYGTALAIELTPVNR